jgi:ketosteroid isomerase-like protein
LGQVSEEDLAVVRRAFEAFTQRDVEAVLELVDPAVEFYAPTAEIAGKNTPYRGREGMRRYFEDVARLWEELEVIPREYRQAGDRVVALGRVYARGPDGLVVDAPAGWLWRLRAGKIVSGRVYTSREEALEAAGLRE